jgi:RimJ/RimL family protein N-acetyltransferase
MRLVIGHAFTTMNLNRIWLHVFDFNARARRVYEKLGFRLEGQLRQDHFCEGKYHDTLILGLLREEWQAP